MPLAFGYFADKIGRRNGMLILVALIMVGHALFCLAAETKGLSLALVGRMVFGLGSESLEVVATSMEASWFQGAEIALAMSIDESLSNIGTVLTDYLQPKLYNISGSISLGAWVGLLICGISMLAGVGAYLIDKKREKEGSTKEEQTVYCLFVELNYIWKRINEI